MKNAKKADERTRGVDVKGQAGHMRCTCGHLDSLHRMHEKPGQRACRADCSCEDFLHTPRDENTVLR